MKFLLAFVGFVVLASQGAESARATLEELKAFEKFSPYPWTQWLKFHPGSAAAVAIAPSPGQFAYSGPEPEDDPEETEEDTDATEETEEDLQTWYKRATLPEATDPKKVKADKTAAKALKDKAKLAKKAEKLAATKKPSILADLEPDFWAPPPSIAPNITGPAPPGYWASKKAMFISKLFAALAEAVVNSTGPPTPIEVATTTPSPRQALLDEISNALYNDNVRSVAPADYDSESEESDESDDDSDEVASVHVVTPKPKGTKLDFLGKLSTAIAAKPPKPTKAPSPWAWGKPTKPTKAPKKSKLAKGKKSKGKPTPAAPGLDYDALAKALLANGASQSAPASPKSKKA